ncbi:DUF1385 domain-containing protein [Bacillus sp. NEB1478]|uniref:DUF1385 domain-containing protein n=1 Tax=Bacillus sp. NEB1478 TaxID=3073816 RepID=UPI00287356A2|nr:DUF1385 domain-containing protein [Bacillus sp. NEB1478]WNB90944.1 DUF1385 domain-containing protein [Bacillus sp. NEB1478]
MNIGGRALKNGIMFQSDNYIVKARYNSDGKITITEESTSFVLDNWLVRFLSSLPFLRSLVALLRILWDSKKVLIITCIIVIPVTMLLEKYNIINDSNIDEINTGFQYFYIIFIFFLFWLIYRIYGKFHGAEHKAINTYLEFGKVEIKQVKKATRISSRCGTNLVFIVIMLKIITLGLHINSPIVNLSVWMIAYEIFELQETKLAFLSKPFIKIGEFFQKLTTAEPTTYELEPAVIGINRLIQLEKSI